MVSISLSEGAVRHVVGRGEDAGVLVYREVLKNGAFLPKAVVGSKPRSGNNNLLILADNRKVPVWVERAFFSQLDHSSISLSLDRGLFKRLRVEISPLERSNRAAGYFTA